MLPDEPQAQGALGGQRRPGLPLGRPLLGHEVHLVRAGDSVSIPGGTPRSVHVEGAEDLEFVYVSAAVAADGPGTA